MTLAVTNNRDWEACRHTLDGLLAEQAREVQSTEDEMPEAEYEATARALRLAKHAPELYERGIQLLAGLEGVELPVKAQQAVTSLRIACGRAEGGLW